MHEIPENHPRATINRNNWWRALVALWCHMVLLQISFLALPTVAELLLIIFVGKICSRHHLFSPHNPIERTSQEQTQLSFYTEVPNSRRVTGGRRCAESHLSRLTAAAVFAYCLNWKFLSLVSLSIWFVFMMVQRLLCLKEKHLFYVALWKNSVCTRGKCDAMPLWSKVNGKCAWYHPGRR